MALSATLSPHVLRYTQRVLRLNTPTGLIKRSIDRPNIYLQCIPIRHGVSLRKDLLFLVPQAVSPHDIPMLPKTMLFMDSRVAVCETTTMLIHRLPPQFRNADVICDYSTALSEQRRAAIKERFILGTCRILVCTEAAGMGVDVSDVVRVIQWTIPRHVNPASFWQRAGRCGRNRDIAGIAILFYNKVQRIPDGAGHPLEIFCEPGTSAKVDQILDLVRSFDSGEFGNRKKGAGPSKAKEPTVPGRENDESLELTPKTIELRNGETAFTQPVDEQTAGNQYINDSTNNSIPHAISADGNTEQRTRQTLHGIKAFATLDRGILWFLSTTGCRRLIVRRYFDDTHISPFLPFSASQDSSLATDDQSSPQKQYDPIPGPCCDNCISSNLDQLPGAISSLLPQPVNDMDTSAGLNGLGSNLAEPEDEIEDTNTQQASRRIRVTAETKAQLTLKLRRFREDVWIREGLNQWMGMFGSSFFLPDKHLQCLVQRCASIEDMDSLAQVLARHRIDLQFSAIGPYAHELLQLITSVVQNPHPPISSLPVSADTPELRAHLETPGLQPLAASSCLSIQDLNITEPEIAPSTEDASSTTTAIQGSNQRCTHGTGTRPRFTGRPTAALKAEQTRLESAIEAEARARFLTAQANEMDGTQWDLSVLGKRARGRPKAAERHARQLAEAARKELQDILLKENDYPLLWQRKLDAIVGEEIDGEANGGSLLPEHLH